MNKLGAISRMKPFTNDQIAIASADAVFIPLFLALLFLIGGVIAFIPLIGVVIFAAYCLYDARKLKKKLAEREKEDDIRYDYIIDILRGIHTLKAFSIENLMIRRYEEHEKHAASVNFDCNLVAARMNDTTLFFANAMIIAVVSFGALMISAQTLTIGVLIATLQLSGRLIQPVQKCVLLLTRYQDYVLAKKQLAEVTDLPIMQPSHHARRDKAEHGELRIEGLSAAEFKPIDLILAPGSVTSIEVKDERVKSALIDILTGLRPAREGVITLDQIDLREYASDAIADNIALLAPDAALFRGTIRNNLTRFGTTPEDKVQDVARLLGIDKDVAKLPFGLDTFLHGDGSDSIPAGLSQRITIARALAKKPKVIIFDGADRALDAEGYNMTFNLMAKLAGRATLLVISDDINMNMLAQNHYILDKTGLVHSQKWQERRTA